VQSNDPITSKTSLSIHTLNKTLGDWTIVDQRSVFGIERPMVIYGSDGDALVVSTRLPRFIWIRPNSRTD